MEQQEYLRTSIMMTWTMNSGHAAGGLFCLAPAAPNLMEHSVVGVALASCGLLFVVSAEHSRRQYGHEAD